MNYLVNYNQIAFIIDIFLNVTNMVNTIKVQ